MRTVLRSCGHGETLRRLLDAVARRGLTVFAHIDHAAAARAVDMELADEVVVVFGNPRGCTPLMRIGAQAATLDAMPSLLDQLAHEAALGADLP
jgi:uncharacterized protein (DUF302 family)